MFHHLKILYPKCFQKCSNPEKSKNLPKVTVRLMRLPAATWGIEKSINEMRIILWNNRESLCILLWVLSVWFSSAMLVVEWGDYVFSPSPKTAGLLYCTLAVSLQTMKRVFVCLTSTLTQLSTHQRLWFSLVYSPLLSAPLCSCGKAHFSSSSCQQSTVRGINSRRPPRNTAAVKPRNTREDKSTFWFSKVIK